MATSGLMELPCQGQDQSGTGRSDRMSQRDGPTENVEAIGIDGPGSPRETDFSGVLVTRQRCLTGQDLGRERLIQFDSSDVSQFQVVIFE